MKKSVVLILLFLCLINSLFALNWKWSQEGDEFLLLGSNGGVELGFRIKRAFMPIKLYTNNSSYLFFVDANDYLRAYKLRYAGSAILNSLISIPLEEEWGNCIKMNLEDKSRTNEITLFFRDEKKRVFSINPEKNQFEMIEESYY